MGSTFIREMRVRVDDFFLQLLCIKVHIPCSDAGRLKLLGVPVVIGGDNLPNPVGIGLTDLPNIGRASGHPGPPGSGITDLHWDFRNF